MKDRIWKKISSWKGHNPSYAWRSIWKIVVKQGMRWKIGDGSHIPL